MDNRQSRAIWDETRKPNVSKKALLKAILYELQPVRFSTIDTSLIRNRVDVTWNSINNFLHESLPSLIRDTFEFMKGRSKREWLFILALFLYWQLVRLAHKYLDAGPTVLIITALITIFTVGLSDNTGSDDGHISAYSVFNRGFQSILGSIDADNLVAQYAGGAGAAAIANNNMNMNHDNHQRQHVPHYHDDDMDQIHNQENNQAEEEQQQEQNDNNNRNRSRKSGKKARRKNRNRESRREIQRQRDAAAALGFGGEEGGYHDLIAINRLIEEQEQTEEEEIGHFE